MIDTEEKDKESECDEGKPRPRKPVKPVCAVLAIMSSLANGTGRFATKGRGIAKPHEANSTRFIRNLQVLYFVVVPLSIRDNLILV